MGKHATVNFSVDQFEDKEPDSPLSEQPMSFEGEYRGMKSGRMHVHLDPELDQAFLDKKATIRIEQSFNKEYRGVYVGDDEEGSAVFDKINQVR
ncbi:MAG: hypothetical protein ABEK50_14530 [bacterium]